ncbi:hypothetical protein GCM10022246_24850 [Pedobacter ginsengiterrae]|uniref:Uncharacterized protein n=1 Tax=Pedobacter ginsengiterrae TaxID=871696 RepID=A0ABP7PV09_9SPHI
MHTLNFNKQSKDDLEVLVKVSSDYSHILSTIKPVTDPRQPTDALRKNMLAYIAFIYSKLLTSIRILHGYHIDDIIPQVTGRSFDQFTPLDLTRSVYESFLQSSWIINDFKTEEERHFVCLWWKVRGLSERVLMAKNRARKDENLDAEGKQIALYTNIIQEKYPDYLEQFSKKFGRYKNSILPNWPKPGQLHAIAGVSKFHHDYIYKFHSLYSHSEPFAMIQLDYFLNNSIDVNEYVHFTAPYLIFFSVATLNNFRVLYPEIDVCINENQQLTDLIKYSTYYLQKEHWD